MTRCVRLHCRSGSGWPRAISRDRGSGCLCGACTPKASGLKPLPQCYCAGSGSLLFSSTPSGAPLKNGETKAPGAASAGRCASCTRMCNVRFRHDMDVCRNRRAHARRGGAPHRKSEPRLRTPRRALINPQYSPQTRAPRFQAKSTTSTAPPGSQTQPPAFSTLSGDCPKNACTSANSWVSANGGSESRKTRP